MSSDMEGRMQDQIEGAICENEQLRRDNAELRARLNKIQMPDFTQRPIPNADALYRELLFAVEWTFPNETRHETALRYIRETEQRRSELTLGSKT